MKNSIIIKRVDNEELSHKTKRALIDIICQNTDSDAPFKLPNEDNLSQSLGVSRNVLRDALMSLEEIGVVTRRRSIGTIANPKIAREHGRLDINPELMRMIREDGYTVRVETLRLGFVFEKEPALEGDNGCYLNVEKVFYADDEVVAYCADHIAGRYAEAAKDSILRLQDVSHYEFLEECCGTSMAYTMVSIDAVMPGRELRETMGLPEGVPTLKLDDLVYNLNHEIVVHSNIYFRSGALALKFLRKNW